MDLYHGLSNEDKILITPIHTVMQTSSPDPQKTLGIGKEIHMSGETTATLVGGPIQEPLQDPPSQPMISQKS